MRQRHIVGVCLYGCNLDSPLRPYLDKVRAFIVDRDCRDVVLLGGFTQRRTFPGKSEAGVAAAYLRETLPAGYPLRIHTRAHSYTTLTNIIHLGEVVGWITGQHRPKWLGEHQDTVDIFCEAQRALKVGILARRFVPVPKERVTIQTDSWELADPRWELLKTANELVAMQLPAWGRRMECQRKALSELR